MPKTIMDKIKDIQADTSGASMLKIQKQAVDIILKAVGTPEWDEFIKNFVDNDNPTQLARLKLQDNLKDDPYIRRSLAYLISNSTCGMGTPLRLGEFVEVLDVDMSHEKLTAAAGDQPAELNSSDENAGNEEANEA